MTSKSSLNHVILALWFVRSTFDSKLLKEEKQGDTKMLLLGTPGIGKSCFGDLMGADFLSRGLKLARNIRHNPTLFYFVDGNRAEVVGYGALLDLLTPTSLFIWDSRDSVSHLDPLPACVVLVIHSSSAKYQQSSKYVPIEVMSVFGEEELMLLVESLHADKASDLKEKFVCVGGNIRLLMDHSLEQLKVLCM